MMHTAVYITVLALWISVMMIVVAGYAFWCFWCTERWEFSWRPILLMFTPIPFLGVGLVISSNMIEGWVK